MININFHAIRLFLEKHGPTILTGLAMFGVAATGYLTHQADKKLIGDVCERIVMTEETETPVKDIVAKSAKANWKIYIPPVAVGLVTMGCAFGANKWHLSREGALAAAAIMYKTSGEELEKKLAEKYGEEEVSKIKREIAESKAENERPPWEEQKPDKMKVWEPYTEQWLWLSQKDLLWAEIIVNKKLCQQWTVTLNDLLSMFGGKKTKLGEKLGWSYEDESFDQVFACGGNLMGRWIDLCPQIVEEIDGSSYFQLQYVIHPIDLTELEQ